MITRYDSFGRVARPNAEALTADTAIARLKAGYVAPDSLLGYGNGRSYGDTCLNPRGTVVDMRTLNRIILFDDATGLLHVEAGALLADVIAHVAPRRFFPPVVPGTQFVTIGGAIANDVHGKNHHHRGTFGAHVERLTLLRSDGQVYECSRLVNEHLFAATIGGMGLTGLILSAQIRMMRVPSIDVAQRAIPFATLDEYFALAEAADAENEYAVAWIDQLASGGRSGRGILLTGNHTSRDAMMTTRRKARLSVPFTPPFGLVNRPFLKVFNSVYRWANGRRSATAAVGHQSFFFPLDSVRHWNRLYGPRGLHQHQSVIPLDTATRTVPALLAATHEARQGSFLTVLKRFGAMPSPGLLSFPRPGYTLTLDFPNHGSRTLALLEELDRITVGAGGAVNPYKDARMSPETFAASFPDWRALEAVRDPAFSSGFWQRTAGRLRAGDAAMRAAAE